ncbi:MAG: Flp family type IVb pilin [Gemmatimonadetes bacterium]|nr:Flp family type IVb pilin [Gemmatimonadota bacterium]
MLKFLKSLWTDESGQGLTEYALIIALVSIGLIIILIIFRNAIGLVFSKISSALNVNPTQY